MIRTKNIIPLIVLVTTIMSCNSDTNHNKNIDTSSVPTDTSNKPIKFDSEAYGSKMKVLEIEVNIPNKSEWKLEAELSIPNLTPNGVTAFKEYIIVSDTAQSIVLRATLEDGVIDTILTDSKVLFLNQRRARVLMPLFDHDSIFVYRGDVRPIYKLEIEEQLNNPTAFDGFRIDNFYVLDRGNNRIVRNKDKVYSTFGKEGNGEGELNNPSSVIIVGGKVHVSDTGNNRMQIFNLEGEYERTYADASFMQPSGLATDGQHVFVSDQQEGAVYMFSNFGKLLYKITDNIGAPTDIFFSHDKLYVADREGSTVKIFSNPTYSNS